ncbi:MAG: hypothetical protein ABL940_08790 [Bacteroidia bacterium]
MAVKIGLPKHSLKAVLQNLEQQHYLNIKLNDPTCPAYSRPQYT